MPTQKSKFHNARVHVRDTPNEFMAIAFPSIWLPPSAFGSSNNEDENEDENLYSR